MSERYETIIYESKDQIATITLNRPDARNAMNLRLIQEMSGALDEMQREAETRVLIITGGKDMFSAGADLKEIRRVGSAELLTHIRRLFIRIENLDRPVVAAIGGSCLAGGCEMSLCCDIRIAGDSAVIGLPEIRFGALAIAGATQRLPRIVGLGRAKELHYTGLPIDAQEAHRIGLVNKVVPADAMLDEAQKFAKMLAERSASAMRTLKFLMNASHRIDLGAGIDLEAFVYPQIGSPEARREAIKKAAQREATYKNIFRDEDSQ